MIVVPKKKGGKYDGGSKSSGIKIVKASGGGMKKATAKTSKKAGGSCQMY